MSSGIFLLLSVVNGLSVNHPTSVKPIIWLDQLGTKPDSGLAEFCRQSVENARDADQFDIRFVNDKTVMKYLPHANQEFHGWSKKAQVRYARQYLVEAHGGTFIDSDIVIKDYLAPLVKRPRTINSKRAKTSMMQESTGSISLQESAASVSLSIDDPMGEAFYQPLARYDGEKGCRLEGATLVCGKQRFQNFFQRTGHDLNFENHKKEFNAPKLELFDGSMSNHVISFLARHLLQGEDFLDIKANVKGNTCFKPGLNSENKLRKLEFIHIPRTGGTTVEDCSRSNKALLPSQKWGTANTEHTGIGHIWDQTARMGGNGKGHWQMCYVQHVPPAYLPQFYEGKDTFCSVRNPYTRAVSQFGFKMVVTGKYDTGCNPEMMNELLKRHLETAMTPTGKYTQDCHYLPQSKFVYGMHNSTGEIDMSKKWCQRVLKFETLTVDFNKHMKSHGHPYALQAHDATSWGTKSPDSCQALKPSQLSPEVVSLIKELYKDDFVNFDYSTEVPV